MKVRKQGQELLGWLVSNEEGDDEFINNASALKGRHYKGGEPIRLVAETTTPAAQPAQQEPVAWYYEIDQSKAIAFAPDRDPKPWQPLYTTPPAAASEGWRMVPVNLLTRWRDAFAVELDAWDIDPPLHHVKTSHDEIDALLNTPTAAPVQDEWELRGVLARLKCWHRLTEDEADELLRFAAARPASALPSKEALAWMVDYNGQPTGNIFDNEEKAAAAMQRLNRQYPQDRRSVIPLVRQQDALTCAHPHPPSDHPSAAGASPAGAQ